MSSIRPSRSGNAPFLLVGTSALIRDNTAVIAETELFIIGKLLAEVHAAVDVVDQTIQPQHQGNVAGRQGPAIRIPRTVSQLATAILHLFEFREVTALAVLNKRRGQRQEARTV